MDINTVDNFDYLEPDIYDEFGGRRKQQRQAARETKKDNKQARKIESKSVKFAHKNQRQLNRIGGKNERTQIRQTGKSERTVTKETGATERIKAQANAGGIGAQIEPLADGAYNIEPTYNGAQSAQNYAVRKEQAFVPLVNSQPTLEIMTAVESTLDRNPKEVQNYENYLMTRGYSPDEIADNDIILAAQIANEYDNEVSDIAQTLRIPYADAEEILWSSDEMQNFDPVTLAFISAAGDKVIKEIGRKQASKGKPFLGQMYDPNTGEVVGKASTKAGSKIGIAKDAVNEGIGAVEKQKVREYSRDYAPMVAAVAVLLIVAGIAFASTSK